MNERMQTLQKKQKREMGFLLILLGEVFTVKKTAFHKIIKSLTNGISLVLKN